jgi:hypothetical protein
MLPGIARNNSLIKQFGIRTRIDRKSRHDLASFQIHPLPGSALPASVMVQSECF